MSSPAELITQIRFQLSQLSSANAHHPFEALARHLARARVYSNILPATGPVSAGGDGGRDFETFRVTPPPAPLAQSEYWDRSSGDRTVAFACSLQKDIEPKIRGDIASILQHGPADEIIYFCEANVPIGHRRKLQSAALDDGVVLQVFDGVAIAEMLAAPDVFWIAQHYLSLPADLLPDRHDEAGWYADLRDRWQSRQALPISEAELFEVKSGLRHATFDPGARADLLSWIAAMEQFLGQDTPRSMVRRASYEIAVAALRGLGDMTPRAPLLASYFSDIEDWPGHADLQDAATLLTYAFTAHVKGELVVDPQVLIDWRSRLAKMVDSEMETAGGPGRKSALLQVRGHVRNLPVDWETPIDADSVIVDWNLMLDVARDAPLYPLETFANFLTRMLALFPDAEAFQTLAARTDMMLAERGGALAAEKAMDRAEAMLRQDRPILALKDLHLAKRRWFTGEHLTEMIETLMTLSSVYRRLGLVYAGKYYGLAAAFMAKHEQRREVAALLPRALQLVVEAECVAGNSAGFFHLLLVAIDAHFRLEHDAWDREKHPWIHGNLSFMAAHIAAMRHGSPEMEVALDGFLESWPEMFTTGAMAIVDSPISEWNAGGWPEVVDYFREVLLDRPFSDLGARRHVRWSALGIDWTISFNNTYDATPLAEQLIAQVQLVLASMAGRDMGLAPCSVRVEITVSAMAAKLEGRWCQDELEAQFYDVTLPQSGWDMAGDKQVLQLCLVLLGSCSVFPLNVLIERLDGEVVGQMYVARPYAEMYRDFVEPEDFQEDARSRFEGFRRDEPWPIESHRDLGWFDGPGPSYDRAQALEAIGERYRRAMLSAGHSIRRLVADARGRTLLEAYRDQGAKDWEIVTTLANLVMNQRLPEGSENDDDLMRTQALALLEMVENPIDAIDLTELTADRLDLQRRYFLVAHLRSWGVELPLAANWNGVERFLVERYRIREDDVDHEDIFGWAEHPGSRSFRTLEP
jgi:hypothetical protein